MIHFHSTETQNLHFARGTIEKFEQWLPWYQTHRYSAK